MLFTDGKDRFYESLMRGVPNFSKRGVGQTKFRYTFADMDCKLCGEYKPCGHELCPYIMDNLDDLLADDAFFQAVHNAEQCETAHRATLITLKERFEGGGA